MISLCGRDCCRCAMHGEICAGCSLCEAAICTKNCGKCYAMCFNRPTTAAYINHIGGPEIELQPNKRINIPVHIPVLPDRFKKMPSYELLPVVGIHGENAFSRNGEKVRKIYEERGFYGALNVDERTQGVLEFYIKDRTLEGFWDKRKSIYPAIKNLNLTAVITPNFSVYEDAPRVDHIYNIKRSSIVYNEMLNADIPVIPDVSWFDKNDLDRWCEEINLKDIKIISFGFQAVGVGMKTSNVWRTALSGFRYLCQNIMPDTEIIIAGLVSPFRIVEVYRAASGRKLHILNQSAYVQSRRGMLSETRMQERYLSFDALFSKNILYFNSIYEEMDSNFQHDADSNLFNTILTWDKHRIQEFYYDYTSQNDHLTEKYGIDKEKLDLAFSIINRQIRKKKIKLQF